EGGEAPGLLIPPSPLPSAERAQPFPVGGETVDQGSGTDMGALPASPRWRDRRTETVRGVGAGFRAANSASARRSPSRREPVQKPEETGAQRRTDHTDVAGEALPAPVPTWEQKPVAVLALELTWPEAQEVELPRYEPWTEAARWERLIVEKVRG